MPLCLSVRPSSAWLFVNDDYLSLLELISFCYEVTFGSLHVHAINICYASGHRAGLCCAGMPKDPIICLHSE
jgi:hypothetical protein